MKIRNIFLTAFAIIGLAMLTTPATQAQTCDGNGSNFVDLNGDGFNDNAPDHDNDGIPNGLDEDYVKNAQDGSGYQKGKFEETPGKGAQNKTRIRSQNGVDEDYVKNAQDGSGVQKRKPEETPGQGMAQNKTMTKSQEFNQKKNFNGTMTQTKAGAQSGNCGSSTGASGGGNAGTGVCDGTSPKGNQNGGGK